LISGAVLCLVSSLDEVLGQFFAFLYHEPYVAQAAFELHTKKTNLSVNVDNHPWPVVFGYNRVKDRCFELFVVFHGENLQLLVRLKPSDLPAFEDLAILGVLGPAVLLGSHRSALAVENRNQRFSRSEFARLAFLEAFHWVNLQPIIRLKASDLQVVNLRHQVPYVVNWPPVFIISNIGTLRSGCFPISIGHDALEQLDFFLR
jgi:hypothetical protein